MDLKQLKEQLSEAVIKAKKARFEDDRSRLMSTLGQDVAQMLVPVLDKLASSAKMNKQDMQDALQEVFSSVNTLQTINQGIDTKPITEAIENSFRSVYIPEPKVNITIPKLDMVDMLPKIAMPKQMDIKGWVSLLGVDLNNPLPVQLRDTKGNPVVIDFSKIPIGFGGGRSGGRMGVVDIGSALTSIPITSGSTLTVDQVSGANWSVSFGSGSLAASIIDSSGVQYSGSNPVPITAGNSLLVDQLSGATWSTYFQNPVNQGDAATALRVVIAGNSDASVTATQTGTWNITNVTNSIAASIIDSGGTQYSGSNPVPITWVSGSGASVAVVGDVAPGGANVNSPPVRIGAVAHTTNPTAYSDGQISNLISDKLGRAITRPVQVRDLIQTAYVALTTGTETTLLAGVAATFLDLIYVMMANSSDAAVMVDIRGGTANGVVASVMVPASGTAGVALPVPIPQDALAATWTVDMPDITGTTVNVSALFSKEI